MRGIFYYSLDSVVAVAADVAANVDSEIMLSIMARPVKHMG